MTVPDIKVVCVTPFTGSGELDEDALGAEVQRLAAHGLGIYLASFGTGEGHLLTDAELVRMIATASSAAGGRAPVYAAAIGFGATGRVIESALAAAGAGADAVQVMPPRPGPPNTPPPPGELGAYYDDVLDAVRTPVHLTNEGFMVGYTVPAGLLADLARDHPQVESVNTTDVDPWQVVELLDRVDGRVPVHSGLLHQLPLALAAGARGPLGFEAVLVPGLVGRMVAAHHAGDLAAFREGYLKVLRLHRVLLRYGNPRSVKAALAWLGVPVATMRRPYLPLPPEAEAEIAEAMTAAGATRGGETS